MRGLDDRDTTPDMSVGAEPREALWRVGEGFVVGGRYRLVRALGRGGMGTVWEAVHLRLSRSVALKLLHCSVPGSTAATRRFEREAQIAASIEHPSCVRVLDLGVDALAGHYLVMELLSGRTLEDELEAGGPMRLAHVVAWLAPVASALDAIHALGLVHRDVKPANIVVTKPGAHEVKLVDFGLAIHADGRTRITQRGTLLGSPQYMAPELVEGADATDRSDTYSLGVTAYELVTGQLPFDGDSLPRLLGAKLDGEARSLADTTGRLFNARVEAVFASALARDPSQRPRSAGALIHSLRAAFARR